MDGASGDYDWQGLIPRRDLPLAVNPDSHFVASANGRPASIGYPYYLGWMWDPSYRTRRVHDMLSGLTDMTIEKMMSVQNDAHDKAAEVFLPVLLSAVEDASVPDAFARQLLSGLKGWDYVARGSTIAPTVWLQWFGAYRKGVWDDEWECRGIEKQPGSWGFTGGNHREPMLEVLEFITREHPNSIWFDDRSTPERETRDHIVRKSFADAVETLKERCSGDIAGLAWDKISILRIQSLTRAPQLAREAGPVPGTSFTVNPGSGGGHVGGGASWRMIVDFGDVSKSVGVYPGGQSEDFTSPLYDDQMKLWATGQYLPLHMVVGLGQLPATAKVRSTVFVP